ncbi:MAG TPA: cyclic nucleotide-binding domain-containing protein [Actinomycetota bacterium]
MSQGLPDMMRRESRRPLGPHQPEQAPRRTKRETATALAGVPMFAGFSKRHLHRLADETDVLSFAPGQAIVSEGDPGETLFVVLTGQGKVTRARRKVGSVMPGDFFGELSAIDGGPRSASVIAETPMHVLRLFRRTLMSLINDEPQVTMKLLDGIVRRVRQVERLRSQADRSDQV